MPPPRRQNSAVDALVEALRHDIRSGNLRPGQRIDLDEWGEGMGASRTPVRLALERLEAEGFVKLSGRRGATIIDVTLNHIEDVLCTRLVLDATLGRVGARNITQPDLDALESLLEQIEAIKLPEDHAKMVEPRPAFPRAAVPRGGRSDDAPAGDAVRTPHGRVPEQHVVYQPADRRRWQGVFRPAVRRMSRKGWSTASATSSAATGWIWREWSSKIALRTEDLRILPGALTPAEFLQLRAIVDEGNDPVGPAGNAALIAGGSTPAGECLQIRVLGQRTAEVQAPQGFGPRPRSSEARDRMIGCPTNGLRR